jgi:hypothetical protein
MTTRSQTPMRTVVSVLRRDRFVLRALVVLLTGTLLVGTSVFGQIEDVECLNLYETYGWAPNKACSIEVDPPPQLSCPPGQVATTWGECLEFPRGEGSGASDPGRDRPSVPC